MSVTPRAWLQHESALAILPASGSPTDPVIGFGYDFARPGSGDETSVCLKRRDEVAFFSGRRAEMVIDMTNQSICPYVVAAAALFVFVYEARCGRHIIPAPGALSDPRVQAARREWLAARAHSAQAVTSHVEHRCLTVV